MAPEAAAALESSSAAAADALHGILVQVAMARGEDTTSFVKKALKNPSVMQVISSRASASVSFAGTPDPMHYHVMYLPETDTIESKQSI